MTELFKCRKAGTQCCAQKSLIRELLDQRSPHPPGVSRNDTLPPIYHQQQHYRPSPIDQQGGLKPLGPPPPPPQKYQPHSKDKSSQTECMCDNLLPFSVQSTSSLSNSVQQNGPAPSYSKYVCGVKGTQRDGASNNSSNYVSFPQNLKDKIEIFMQIFNRAPTGKEELLAAPTQIQANGAGKWL
jgi:plasma kallikrein